MDSEQKSPEDIYWDKWQVEQALKLQMDYGHSYLTAMGLASMSRFLLQQAKPGPLFIVTGI